MRKPTYEMNMFKERRRRLCEKIPGGALIIASHPEHIRNDDVHYAYRQDSNFFYLSGWEEPGSVLVIRPGQNPETTLFVRPKDKERETWDGFRYGPEGAKSEFQVDATFLISEFSNKIVELLKPVEKIYYRWNIQRDFDLQILEILENVRRSHGRSGRGYLPVFDAREVVGELRIIKDHYEITQMRKAGEISARAHLAAMRATRPGVGEREIVAVLASEFYKLGAAREGYNHIVASGNNSTTLHYNFNDQVCRDGDLLLIDAGAEYNYYTGDITRTFPVNGKFSEAQRLVYDGVLSLQKDLIAMSKPGLPFKELQDTAIDRLTQLMIELGLLKGDKKQLIGSGEYRRYYPHGVSHWLGSDVHDVGKYLINGEARRLEPGMCFTIEPGLYIPGDDAAAPAALRGIGVRIEDDILITSAGCEVLTALVPKDITEIEAVVGMDKR